VAFPKLAVPSKPKSTQPKFIDKNEAEALERDMLRRISERAYALYEQSGCQDGHAEEHWRQAESEVLKRKIDVRESGSWMSLNATIPDISAENVHIYVDPVRVLISVQDGSTAEGASRLSTSDQPETLLAADLPTEVDPPTATASLKEGQLNLMIKKRHAADAASISGSAARKGKT
jgi:HSP20 family molecular chaperone IbpA